MAVISNPRVVIIRTAAEWVTFGSTILEPYETGRESDTGKEKTGNGTSTYAALSYDTPDGSPFTGTAINDLTTGTPATGDLIPYVHHVSEVVATAAGSAADKGTAGCQILIGNKIYNVVVSGATGNQINRGTTDETYAANIAAKITTDTADTLCTCVATLAALAFTANAGLGAAGNHIKILTDDPHLTLDAAFAGGVSDAYVLMAEVQA